MRLHPINTAEAIIACFFDSALTPEKQWTLQPGPGTRNLRMGRAYTTMANWDAATPGKTALTWSWEGNLDVGGYDGLFIQGGLPSWATLRFSAKLDGRWQLICESPGYDNHEEYSGPFQGRVLQGLRLEITPSQGFAGSFSISYIGVYHSGRLKDYLAFENPTVYPADWPEYIKPLDGWESGPKLGLYFGAQDLPALRRKLASPPYVAFSDMLRRQARENLSLEPEKQIRRYQRIGPMQLSYSSRGRDRGTSLWRPMEQCAFFGLLDDDADLTRMALRCAIALAHTDRWGESLTQHDFRGSCCEWRGFSENHTCIAYTAAMDWAGGALTSYGMDVLRHSLYFKGLAPIKYDFARNEYIYHMNQAAVFSPGRIAAILALRPKFPRMDWELEQAYRDLDETARDIIRPDGSYSEGPAYYAGVAYYSLLSYILRSRQQGVPTEQVISPGLLKGADFIGLYTATAPATNMLWLSDGPRPAFQTDWLAMFAAITADARWKGLLGDCIMSEGMDQMTRFMDGMWSGTSVRTLIFGPSDLSDRRPMVPVFAIQPSSGHATSLRQTIHGPVRLHLCGSSSTEGHSHQDKGAIVLEVFGEELLIDRGITFYSDPMTQILKTARLHNLVTPTDEGGQDLQQINPCPAAVCPAGDGDVNSLRLSMETTPAWGSTVRRAARTIESPDPLHFTISDELETPATEAATFHLHSRFPISVSGNTATFQAGLCKLLVRWDWPGQVVSAGVELCDGAHKPVNHLAVRAAPAQRHRLVTHLEIVPAGQ